MLVTKNKICSRHGHLFGKSYVDHSCSPGVCGANLPMQHTIGDEFNWARESMADLLCENNLEVREVTTDPDSSAGRAADSLYQDGLLKESLPITWTLGICPRVFESPSKGTKSLLRSCPQQLRLKERNFCTFLHLMQSTGSMSRSTRSTPRTPGMPIKLRINCPMLHMQ